MSGPELCGGLSGIVLAGGASRRMGQDKSKLRLNGKTFLQIQTDKLFALGICDVMLSGAGCPALPGTRVIPDEAIGKGPLGGLYACLRAAQDPACLVVSVDVPLVPVSALARLCREHSGSVTVLRHGGQEEPLLGVYDRDVAGVIARLIHGGEYSVRALKREVSWNCLDYSGGEELLMNCNTPEDFAAVKKLAAEL